jgi:hypothetical protein
MNIQRKSRIDETSDANISSVKQGALTKHNFDFQRG